MFDKQHHGGISRYFANLISAVNKLSNFKAAVSVLFTENYHLRAIHSNFLNAKIASVLFSKKSRISKWNKLYSRYCIVKNDFDIFHPTYFHPYFLSILKKPFVLTVHDMIYEIYPEYFKKDDLTSENKRMLIEQASHIIAISETTKKDLIRLLTVPAEKITVIYHGHTSIKNSIIPTMTLPTEYLLFVGARDNYKNFGVFAQAAGEVIKRHPDLQLVCVGGGMFTAEEQRLLRSMNLEDKTTRYDVSDEILYWIYRSAKAFVYPSLYEGFGLPILEAFEAECPVILSNTPSFLEVGADAALYFDPNNFKDLVECLERVLEIPHLRQELLSLGRQRLAVFTMEKCITETIEVYKKCLND